ncbi:pancreatic progenitor cell differentiation and proliferation factor [Homo sapiens]|uniref:Pancreatic progenitor cell differentiation and proliferation factor n=1 Tax=Homo sapiens TaxID=9606 RepID=X6R7I6_HUMAN|nr:pancreatic progenitor cell differentiation and proliferation factor [Homo sapiens]KAI4006354.1 pancreatic progenitor cell differentiation and proliferation factor [Homo sapiens]
MAAIPSSGSLVATHDYYRRRLGSTSSNSSCSSTECPGEAIPHPPGECRIAPFSPRSSRSWQHQDPTSLLSGLPKADPGHWWASFFFGKSTLPFMATVLESAEHSEPPQASSSMTACGLARDAPRKQPGGQSSTASAGPPS